MRAARILAALAICSAPLARADDATPVELRVGEARNVCSTGLAACPVSSSLCDDPKVAVIENGPAGAELKGVSPGTTLCSMLGHAIRRVIRVTVTGGGARGPR